MKYLERIIKSIFYGLKECTLGTKVYFEKYPYVYGFIPWFLVGTIVISGAILILYLNRLEAIFYAVYIGSIDAVKIGEIDAVNIGSGLIAIVGLVFFYRRVRAQEQQIGIQIKQRIDERFTAAVHLLGSDESSARTGAVYSLYQLALDDDKYLRQIAKSYARMCALKPRRLTEKAKKPIKYNTKTALVMKFKPPLIYCSKKRWITNRPKSKVYQAYMCHLPSN